MTVINVTTESVENAINFLKKSLSELEEINEEIRIVIKASDNWSSRLQVLTEPLTYSLNELDEIVNDTAEIQKRADRMLSSINDYLQCRINTSSVNSINGQRRGGLSDNGQEANSSANNTNNNDNGGNKGSIQKIINKVIVSISFIVGMFVAINFSGENIFYPQHPTNNSESTNNMEIVRNNYFRIFTGADYDPDCPLHNTEVLIYDYLEGWTENRERDQRTTQQLNMMQRMIDQDRMTAGEYRHQRESNSVADNYLGDENDIVE